MVRAGHTQEGSRNTLLALLTGHPPSLSRPLPLPLPLSHPSPSPSPSLPSPSYSYSTHPHSPHIISQLVRELLVLFCQSQREAPVSSNHQEPDRLQEGEGEEGGPLRFPIQFVDPRSAVQGWWSTWMDSSHAHLV